MTNARAARSTLSLAAGAQGFDGDRAPLHRLVDGEPQPLILNPHPRRIHASVGDLDAVAELRHLPVSALDVRPKQQPLSLVNVEGRDDRETRLFASPLTPHVLCAACRVHNHDPRQFVPKDPPEHVATRRQQLVPLLAGAVVPEPLFAIRDPIGLTNAREHFLCECVASELFAGGLDFLR